MRVTVSLSPAKVVRRLAVAVALLTLAGVAGQLYADVFAPRRFGRVIQLFSLDAEQSVPTWYSSSTLIVCSMLLAIIAFIRSGQGAPYVRHWGALAVIFLGLSLDEAVSLHEMTIQRLQEALNAGGILTFTWVVPASVFVVLLALVYRRFLGHLPARIRRLFVLAGAVFLLGAIGMELVEGRHVELHGWDLTFQLLAAAEELLEMTGILVFIYALLSYISLQVKEVQVRIGSPGS